VRMYDEVSCLHPVTEVSNEFIIDPSLLVQFINFGIPTWIEDNVYHIPESLREFALLSAEREQYADSFRKFFEGYRVSSLMIDWTLRDTISYIDRFRPLSTINLYDREQEHDEIFKTYYETVRRKYPTRSISFDENHIRNYPVLDKMQLLIGEGFNYEDAFLAETLMLMLKTKQPLLMHSKRFAGLLRSKMTLLEPALGTLRSVLGRYYLLKNQFENWKYGIPKGFVKFILTAISANTGAVISHPMDLVAVVIDP